MSGEPVFSLIGRAIGSYVIERALGAGAMGEVYLAVHRRIGKRVAIKFLLPAYSASSRELSRFFNEARASSLRRAPARSSSIPASCRSSIATCIRAAGLS